MKRYYCTCDCGAVISRNIEPSYRCGLCGGIIIHLIEKDLGPDIDINFGSSIYSPVIPYEDNKLGIDISLKYREEIVRISGLIEKMHHVIAEKNDDLMAEKRYELNRISDEISKIKKINMNLAMEGYSALDSAMKGILDTKPEAIKDALVNINANMKVLEEKRKEYDSKSEYYNNRLTAQTITYPEARLVDKLFKMRDDYQNRIKADRSKYGRYISLIYCVDVNNDINSTNELIDACESLSDEDDKYLKSLSDDYKGKSYYKAKALRVQVDAEMHKRDIARDIIIDNYFPSYSIDLDPYSRHASRACYESYISNIIAKFDECINGTKL